MKPHIDGCIQESSVNRTVLVKRCPAPTAVFTGRNNEILQVSGCIVGGIHERRVCVVHGLGGAGKTQLARKAIELNRDSWTHVLYVDASSREAIENTLQDFSKVNSIGDTHEDTLAWLESCHEPWLIVFDNADHPSLSIHEYFPGGTHGSMLITTRLLDLEIHAQGAGSICHISSMSREDALALLFKVARVQGQAIAMSDKKAADALLEVSQSV